MTSRSPITRPKMTPASSSTSINPSYPLYSLVAPPPDPIDSLPIRVDARVVEEFPERSDHPLADLSLRVRFMEDGLDAIEHDADSRPSPLGNLGSEPLQQGLDVLPREIGAYGIGEDRLEDLALLFGHVVRPSFWGLP